MPIPDPKFDARSYRELVAETMARVPSHTPEWTNLNDSDPGVTLLQLFAFLGESIIYRANLIPERNRRKFLRLLRLPPLAAEPAQGIVAFANSKGPLGGEHLVSADTLVTAGRLPYRTIDAVDVLPIETRLYYKQEIPKEDANGNTDPEYERIAAIYRKLYASFEKPGTELSFYRTVEFETPDSGVNLPAIPLSSDGSPMDGALWLAVLARDGDNLDEVQDRLAGKVVTIGVMPSFDGEGCKVRPLSVDATESKSRLLFEMPNTDAAPGYRKLKTKSEVDVLAQPGVVEVTLPASGAQITTWRDLDPLTSGVGNYPPSIEETDIEERLVTWIRVRVDGGGSEAAPSQTDAKVSWIGANATMVEQRARVPLERLPDGTGEADQTATLANTPVILKSVQLRVNGETWTRIDDLTTAAAEVPASVPRLADDGVSASTPDPSKAFTLDRESGEVKFGDGANGMRPPAGAVVQVSYDYGGGLEGQVAIGSINKVQVSGGVVEVGNPVPTWGGSDAESLDDAERRIPSYLRHRDRLVSEGDFHEIVERTPGVSLGRVEILPVVHPDVPLQVSEGSVTVLVVPTSDALHPLAPRPDTLVLEAICAYLAPRRLVTTELHVRGPEYKGINVSVGIEVVAGADEPQVREDVEREIERFLSPLEGGYEGKGWPLGKSVDPGEIAAAATRTAGVAKVVGTLVSTGTEASTAAITIEGLELPELLSLSVAAGDPVGLDELVGETVGGGVDSLEVFPVPVTPEGC